MPAVITVFQMRFNQDAFWRIQLFTKIIAYVSHYLFTRGFILCHTLISHLIDLLKMNALYAGAILLPEQSGQPSLPFLP
jgi:hypothetical protein